MSRRIEGRIERILGGLLYRLGGGTPVVFVDACVKVQGGAK